MKTVRLGQIAIARSGDKGNSTNVGVIALDTALYQYLRGALTAERVAAHLGPLVNGPIERYELPNLPALNFVIDDALEGKVPLKPEYLRAL